MLDRKCSENKFSRGPGFDFLWCCKIRPFRVFLFFSYSSSEEDEVMGTCCWVLLRWCLGPVLPEPELRWSFSVPEPDPLPADKTMPATAEVLGGWGKDTGWFCLGLDSFLLFEFSLFGLIWYEGSLDKNISHFTL